MFDDDYFLLNDVEGPDLEAVRSHLSGLLETVYKTGNIEKLEASIEELCAHLDVHFKGGKPVIRGSQNDPS